MELLGQGNMGRIYRVRDQLGRDLALKVILGQVASAEGLARFEREGQAMAAIPRHKHVIGVHSAGTSGRLPYLVLDFVEGENLDEVLRRGPLPAAQAALVCEKLSRALDHVHQSGVLHRDLKPANVLIRAADGEPLLTDFGLAGLQGADTLTRTGDVIGTPLYMAPEQLLGLHREVDGRADVWSLGVMLFEMAAGALPFPGTTMLEVTDAVLGAEPPRLHDRCPDADPSLTRIVNLALAKDKEERLPSPGALAAALRTWRKQRQGYDLELDLPPQPGRKALRRWLVPLAAAALFVALAGIGVYLALSLPFASDPGSTPAPSPDTTSTRAAPRGDLSAAASTAIEAVEAAIRSPNSTTALEKALSRPILKDLPYGGKIRIKGVGFKALNQVNLEIRRTRPRPERIAGLLRAAGTAQTLSGAEDLGGGQNVDGVLLWLTAELARVSQSSSAPTVVEDQAWLRVLEAMVESGYRPSQTVSGSFLDQVCFLPRARAKPTYLRLLRAMVALGAPTFDTQFNLKRKPRRPSAITGHVGTYVYLRCMLSYRDLDEATHSETRLVLNDLMRTKPDAFDPRTLAQGLNLSIDASQLDAEIERLEAALKAAPDSFFGWDGLTKLYLWRADALAQAKDRRGVQEALRRAEETVARGYRALEAGSPTKRAMTEALALTRLSQRHAELLNSLGKDDTVVTTVLKDELLDSSRKRGRARYQRVRTYLP